MDGAATWGTHRMGEAHHEAAAGDPGVVFARLAAAHLDAAYRLATFILGGDRSEAEDAVHDAALRAWQHFGDLREPDRFAPWFTRIVVNSCRDRLGARRVRPITFSNPIGAATPDPADAIVRADALERALLTLSPDHRVVVALRYVADCSLDEIAARTGERAGTVKSRLHYALHALRAALDADARDVTR